GGGPHAGVPPARRRPVGGAGRAPCGRHRPGGGTGPAAVAAGLGAAGPAPAVDPVGGGRAPRPALHDAGAGDGAGGGDGARLHLLRPPGVARAVEGPAVPQGHHGGRPPGGGDRLRERDHGGAAGGGLPGADRAAVAALGVDPDRPMVVFIGTMEPRKNVPALVRAFDEVADAHPEAVLVLAGQRGWGGDEVERAEMAAERHRNRIVRTGYVPDDAVPALLRSAAVVAYPSLAEGYGLPALEALACGAPLVTTSGTAMAELAAGAAVLVPPGDTADLAVAIDAVLSDAGGGSTAERRQRGLAVAATRTWAASADRHLEAYRRAAR